MMTKTMAMTKEQPKEEKGSSTEYFTDLFRRGTRDKKQMTLQTVELKVTRMDCEGWELKVKKALERMSDTYDKKVPLGYMRKDIFDSGVDPNCPDELYGSMLSEEDANACSLM